VITGKAINGAMTASTAKKAAGAVDTALERTVLKLALKMASLVKTKLTGESLKVRTGRLRRSIHFEMDKSSNSVVATVGTNVQYARVHELGGTFQIPAHLRMQTVVFGRPMKQPRKVMVKGHPATFPRRSFLEASLKQMESEIQATLAAEVGGELRRVISEGAR
jgi:phage gpG-like protein